MKTPRLNRRLLLEAQRRIADGAGGYSVEWHPLGTVWADISARTGREALRVGEPVATMSYRIVLRAAPVGDVLRPLPAQRFREGTRCFRIEAVVENDNDGRYLACFATEEVAT